MAIVDPEEHISGQSGDKVKLTGKQKRAQKIKLNHNKYSSSKSPSVEVIGSVSGIQINYSGEMNITTNHSSYRDLSENAGGWIMCANNKTGKLIYFNYGGKPITESQRLFSYKGNPVFHSLVVAGGETQIRGEIEQFETDIFKILNTNFSKLDRKFRNINFTNRAKITPKSFTGYEVPKIKKKRKRSIKKIYKKNIGGGY